VGLALCARWVFITDTFWKSPTELFRTRSLAGGLNDQSAYASFL
jgi:hypothetical protein